MRLLISHPEVATRNCQACLKYAFDDDGIVVRGRDGKPELRLMDCGPSFLAPCRNDNGCPKGTPEKPRTLHPINQQAYQHYRECRAVGSFPDDPIVRRNAAIIRDVIDNIESGKAHRFEQLILKVTMKNG